MFKLERASAIPQELKQLRQWVGADANKTPVRPGSRDAADVTTPSTWGSFDEALAGVQSGAHPYIGFVFTTSDPYVFIDLDAPKDPKTKEPISPTPEDQDRFNNWLKRFNSYAERSASGFGLHIIVKGRLNLSGQHGIHTKHFEIYEAERYGIFTGDVLAADVSIQSRQTELDATIFEFKQTQPKFRPWASQPIKLNDQQIKEAMWLADNSAKFQNMYEGGDWEPLAKGGDGSQSVADFALLEYICFHTKNDEQAIRLFKSSMSFRPQKYGRHADKHIRSELLKIRQLHLENEAERKGIVGDVETAALTAQAAIVARTGQPQSGQPSPPPAPVLLKKYPRPPGTLGEVADFIYNAAFLPVREISYAAAIAFGAGLCGRQYNVSNTGLNQYIIVSAGTGMGKGDAKSGINLLFRAIRSKVPQVEGFMGPGDFASGNGLLRNLSEREMKSCVSVIDEFGIRLSSMSDPRANSADMTLKAVLLALYQESGKTAIINPTVYSDTAKNIQSIDAPALTILGQSTPTTFLKRMTKEAVAEGIVSRFLVVGYDGDAQMPNENRRLEVPGQLCQRLADLAENVIRMAIAPGGASFIDVEFTEAAYRRIKAFDREIVDKRNTNKGDPIIEILNRAGLKARRLAALAACLDHWAEPQIKVEHVEWAIEFCEADAAYMMSRFTGGYAADEDDIDSQLQVIRDKIMKGLTNPPVSKDPQINRQAELLRVGIIPYSYLNTQVAGLAVFKGARQGVKNAIKSAITTLVEYGELIPCSRSQLFERFKYNGEAYQLPDQTPGT